MSHLLIINMLWKKIKKYLPFIGIALFVYLLVKLNIAEILKQALETNKFYLAIAAALVLFFLFFQTLQWHVLARKQKIPISFGESFKINLMTSFYGLITPGKLGVLMRVEYLKKYSNGGKGLSNFIVDKFLSLISLLFMILLFGFIVLKDKLEWINGENLIYGLLIFFLILGIFLFFYDKKRGRILLKVFYRKFMPKRMREKAKMSFDSFYEDLPKKEFLIGLFFLHLVVWVVNYVIVYVVALSLGIDIKFIYFIAIYPLATLVAQIPITISGLGTREAVLIALFSLFGIGAIKVFSMSIIGLFIMAIIPSLIAIPFILKERKKHEIHKIEESRRESRERSEDN